MLAMLEYFGWDLTLFNPLSGITHFDEAYSIVLLCLHTHSQGLLAERDHHRSLSNIVVPQNKKL
jgi:hypothetical protein